MADSTILPGQRAALVDSNGVTSPEFYRFFRGLSVTAELPSRVDDLTVRVGALENGHGEAGNVVGRQSIVSAGVLSNGIVNVRLDGDVDTVPAMSSYGALADGVRGWHTYSANFATLTNGDGTHSLDLADLANSGTGTALVKITRDAKGRVSGTSAATTDDLTEGAGNLYFTAARVRATVLTGLSLATNAVIAATDSVLSALGKLQAQITDNLLSSGYIDGLKMVWVSGAALTVTSGAAYIPSLGKVLRATADIAKTSLALTASTWYHVYLYSNAGTPDVEISTTAPDATYSGTARTKTGDASRRYVGSVRVNATNAMHRFVHNLANGSIKYLVDLNNADLFLVNNGTSTTTVSVSCATAVPGTSRVLSGFAENNASGGLVFVSNADAGSPASSNILEFIRAGRTLLGDFTLTSSQALTYMVSSPGALALYATGYVFER